jgi:carbonic anhydrase
MTTLDILKQRNTDFAAHRFAVDLPLMPKLKTLIIGCADARVDPAHLLGLEPGEALVLRNIGGRITPVTLREMALLSMIPQVEGAGPVRGFNLVVLHHTDCGITRLVGFPDRLADYFGIAKEQLEAKAITDPYASVRIDIAALKANPNLPGDIVVSGLVYDVATGLVETVVAPASLRAEGSVA